MPMKLYADPDNYKTHAAIVAAKYAGMDIESPAKPAVGPGQTPVLETDQGCVFSSVAIIRYICRVSRCAGLYGQNILDGGAIDSWVELSTNELEVPLLAWRQMPDLEAQAKEDVSRVLTILNNHLLVHTYFVGDQITLADICISCALVAATKASGKEFLQPFGNVCRWLNTCMLQPEFISILGNFSVKAAATKKEAAPKDAAAKQQPAPKKEAAAKKEAAPKKEAAAKKEAAPKKEAAAKKEAAPNKDAAPKKEAAAKKEAKGKKEKEAPKQEEEEKEPTPEELAAARKAQLKKVIKEGGKRGVEIEGAADMGGLQFFCCAVDEPQGDLEFLEESVNAMNAESDPTQEERKGGSGNIGKMIFSAGAEQLAVIAYVPEAKQGELSCEEWLKKVLASQGGQVLKTSEELCSGVVKTNSDKGVFPLKIREPMILEANNFLRSKGLFPEDDDDDDEMVFGDDDFPS